jgi:PAS domain-containing protein
MDDVFNSVPVGLYRTALGGRLLEANPTLAELLACPSVDDLLGSNVIDFYANPADRMRLLNALLRPARQGLFPACRLTISRFTSTRKTRRIASIIPSSQVRPPRQRLALMSTLSACRARTGCVSA